MTQPGKLPGLYNPKKWENPEPAEVRGLPWVWGVKGTRNLTADTRPCPPLVPATVSDGRNMRYCTYSAGFTRPGVSRNPWSQCFGQVGYCTYRAHMCTTCRGGQRSWLC